jgi:hypothetical protein
MAKWVERTYTDSRATLSASYSDDGEWITNSLPVSILPSQYRERKIAVEYLRRLFVMDGWVRSTVHVDPQARHITLLIEGPRDALVVEAVDRQEIIPEVNGGESVQDAIDRFAGTGAVYYPSPWERITISPQAIRCIYQRSPDAPVANTAAP